MLVLRGEAGIGKSALLDGAVERAHGLRVVRALGVESEVEVAFSGLHELLRPLFPFLEALPGSQAVALRTALALGGGGSPELLAVYGGALSLLAAAAEDQPLLCVIDDAHLLDDATASVVTFVARRLDRDGIGILFAVREPELRTFPAKGLPDLHMGGLDDAEARRVLAAQLPPDVGALVTEQLIEISHGNPLALIELSLALTEQQLAGREPLQVPIRVTAAVELAFVRRLERLPVSTRVALLVVAASDVNDQRTIVRALEALDIEPESLRPAEAGGLVSVTSSVDFSIRSPDRPFTPPQRKPSVPKRTGHWPAGPTKRASPIVEPGTSQRRQTGRTRKSPQR